VRTVVVVSAVLFWIEAADWLFWEVASGSYPVCSFFFYLVFQSFCTTQDDESQYTETEIKANKWLEFQGPERDKKLHALDVLSSRLHDSRALREQLGASMNVVVKMPRATTLASTSDEWQAELILVGDEQLDLVSVVFQKYHSASC